MFRYLVALITPTLFLISFPSTAQDWQPADLRLSTPWTDDVSPEKVWPEYPRPQLVRSNWQNLNGLWDYAIERRDEDRPEEWDGQILVPFPIEASLSGVHKRVRPSQRLWYHRTFETPERPNDGRLLLHFGAVDWRCTVWVNDKEVGSHQGGYDPFTFDITDALDEDAAEQELVVAVWDPTDEGYQPRGKQVRRPNGIWYTPVTGIWQTVWLEPVPNEHIRALKITTDIKRGSVTVGAAATGGDRLRVSGSDGGNEFSADDVINETVEVQIPNAQLWSPDSPKLYDLKVELLSDGEVVDTVNTYAGLRKIEVKKDAAGVNRLWLNNEVVFQYGPLDQGWWPDGLYTPATDEAFKHDIEMTKKFGMNMARKHVKVEPARWYYWCDRLGLLVWQDMPSGDLYRNPESRTNYMTELRAMVDAFHNHPSIVMWVPFNEGWGQHDTEEIASWVKEYDPTRLVNESSGWHDRGSGDVSDSHSYPGPDMRRLEDDRAVVLGEFGGLGLPVSGHTWQDEENWGYRSYETKEALTDAYVELLTKLRPLIAEGLSAAIYTQTSDVEIEVNGLMTYDRKVVKMDLQRITEAARKLFDQPQDVTAQAAAGVERE